MSDVHQIVPKVDVFKVFSTERRDIEVSYSRDRVLDKEILG